MTEQPDVAQPSEKNTVGEIDPSKWDEQQAVTGRPNDPVPGNSTFAERASSRPAVSKVSEPAEPAKKTTARKK